jgi:hypothetical protein
VRRSDRQLTGEPSDKSQPNSSQRGVVTQGFADGRRSPTICLGACASPPCASFWWAFRPLSPRIEASRASNPCARWGEAFSHTPALNYGKIFRPLCVSTPNLPPGCHQAFSMPPVSSQTTREGCCNAQVPPLHLDSAHVDYLQSMCEKQQVTAVVCCSWLCAPQCLCMQKPLFVEAALRHRCMRACGRQTTELCSQLFGQSLRHAVDHPGGDQSPRPSPQVQVQARQGSSRAPGQLRQRQRVRRMRISCRTFTVHARRR